ncbi:hypothetical protein [Jannaschia aquimarina]|uniref:Uncharacterized protein n=1 Tax=Jannaschia aquimarina TaxID=935700 RepID=A0A0D1EPP7_9RHOB|nr:hypothetical protein [Jannaschia aquimarina]KIT17625.1 hypothetical protein jaqu_05160 [Jannaschia aquimarina]SNS80531.1 hypothetical protein SAMN05421775_102365 [Jannaschia aquimarina]
MTTKVHTLNAGLAALLAATLALFASHSANAEDAARLLDAQGANCGPRAGIVSRLASHFGETRRGIGLGTKGRIVEVFASDATGSWTIAITLPDGRMCLMASGRNWEDRMDDLSHLADADA